MRRKDLACVAILFLTIPVCPLLAQMVTQSPAGSAPPNSITTRAGRARREPCWQIAGISQSAMQQRKSLEGNARAQVQSVCNDSSLTPQQKREKIRQIHQQTQQQVEGVITPQQRQALQACWQQRGEGAHGGGRGMHPKGEGPCGEMTGPREPSPKAGPPQ
jgi:Spy/CpxP family protein refolding chaperone